MRKKHISCIILVVILLAGIKAYSQETPKDVNQTDNIKAAFNACYEGDIDKLKEYIANGVDVNAKNGHAESFLNIIFSPYSMSENALDIAKYLIANGADINALTYRGYTPLIGAIDRYICAIDKNKNLDIVKFLIDNGAEIDLLGVLKKCSMRGSSTEHESFVKNKIDVIKLLIDNGAKINVTDENGMTPLLQALKIENFDIAEILISKGADTNVLDNWDKESALNSAASRGYKDIVELLISHGGKVTVTNTNKSGYTLLHSAATSDSVETVEYLLSLGTNINVQHEYGSTPLALAIRSYESYITIHKATDSFSYYRRAQAFYWRDEFDRAIEDCTTAIELDPNDGSNYKLRGYILFQKGEYLKAKEDWKKAIQIYWGNGLSLYNIPDYYDEEFSQLIRETALNHLQDLDRVTGNSIGIAGKGAGTFYLASLVLADPFDEELLLKMLHDENPYIRAMGIICLARENASKYEKDISSLYNDTTSVSYLPGGDIGGSITIGELAKEATTSTLYCFSPEYAEYMLEVTRESIDKDPNNIEIVKYLIENGADINIRDSSKNTPLHFAAALKKTNIAELLINHGADINAKNNIGESPLYIATDKGNSDMIEFLIKNGAGINNKDKQGRTPLKLAIDMKYYGIADLLRKYGAKE